MSEENKQEAPPVTPQEFMAAIKKRIEAGDPVLNPLRALDRGILLAKIYSSELILLGLHEDVDRWERELIKNSSITPGGDFQLGWLKAANDIRKSIVTMLTDFENALRHRVKPEPSQMSIVNVNELPEAIKNQLTVALSELLKGGM